MIATVLRVIAANLALVFALLCALCSLSQPSFAQSSVTVPQYKMIDLGVGTTAYTQYSVTTPPYIAPGPVLAWTSFDSNDNANIITWNSTVGRVNISKRASIESRFGIPSGVNSSGQVAGEVVVPPTVSNSNIEPTNAFVYTPSTTGGPGSLVDIGTLGYGGGTDYSQATAVNSSGQVAGDDTETNYVDHAFLWTPGGAGGPASNPQMLDLSQIFPSFSYAVAINDASEVVGNEQQYDNNETHALLYSGESVTDLGTIPPVYQYDTTFGLGINQSGQVFGAAYRYDWPTTFLWTPSIPNGSSGTMIGLEFPPGTADPPAPSVPTAMNNQAQITGILGLASSSQAFLWTPNSTDTSGSFTALGALGAYKGNIQSEGYGLNDSATVVGTSIFTDPITTYQTARGFVYSSGFMYDLNTILTIHGAHGLVVTSANSIDSSGDIGATAVDLKGVEHIVLLKPVGPTRQPSLPSIYLIYPASAQQYSRPFTLDVEGSGFTPNTVVRWNGRVLASSALSNELVTAQVTAQDLTHSGPLRVTTVNTGNSHSTAATFTITSSSTEPIPTVTSFDPGTIFAAEPSRMIKAVGSGLFTNTQFVWGGSTYMPTSVSPDHVIALIELPADALQYPSQNNMIVSNPPYVEGMYSPVLLVITKAPIVRSFKPRSLVQRGPSRIVTFYGENFYREGYSNGGSTVVQINGGFAQVAQLGPHQIRVYVPHDLLLQTGNLVFTITNGPPAGGTVTINVPILPKT